MDLHHHQQDAVDMCERAVIEGLKVLVKGKAGTGKTTVTKEALARVEAAADGRKVRATSFTNKAMLRMIEVGFDKRTAMTCHRLLYYTQMFFDFAGRQADAEICKKALKEQDRGNPEDALAIMVGAIPGTEEDREQGIDLDLVRVQFLAAIKSGAAILDSEVTLKPEWDRSDIIIVDEVGMLPFEMAEQIMDRYDTVIFMGDHRQLKPVNGPDTINVMEVDAVTELTHVYRSGSNILDWADRAETDRLGHCGVVSARHFDDMAREGYVFIAHTNADVFKLNTRVRIACNALGKPRIGEPLIAYNKCTAIRKERAPLKPTMQWLMAWREKNPNAPKRQWPYDIETIPGDDEECWKVYKRPIAKNQIIWAEGSKFHFNGDVWIGIRFEEKHMIGDPWYLTTVDFWNIDGQAFAQLRKAGMLDVFFAHAITAHRAQGSEFPKVCVKVRDRVTEQMRDPSPEADDDRRRFNYSAITRAKKKVVVCSNVMGL